MGIEPSREGTLEEESQGGAKHWREGSLGGRSGRREALEEGNLGGGKPWRWETLQEGNPRGVG